MKPRVVISKCINIFQNLSCEELFCEEALSPVLFLYQNDKTIVIGRNQNPWKEIHIDRMEADKVNLCRRKSGGGAVYQDLGNTCFSFINPKSPQDFKQKNNSIVLRALSILDIEAETSGRNDIVVDGKKISGSAYKIQNIGSNLHTLHHGTMLINTNFQALVKYLNPSKAKLESKGVKSVSSRVTNLTEFNSEIGHEKFVKSMTKSFIKDYPDAEILTLQGIPPKAREKANLLQKWDWVYGENVNFSHQLETRFKWGIFDINFEVVDGIITKCKVFSDCLNPELVELVQKTLIGKKYGKESLIALKSKENEEFEDMIEDIISWLREAI
jgi:lipoate---protein ligase